ncbi:hypothetical protein RI367_003160 [Sorochytrium milnesiophthora]
MSSPSRPPPSDQSRSQTSGSPSLSAQAAASSPRLTPWPAAATDNNGNNNNLGVSVGSNLSVSPRLSVMASSRRRSTHASISSAAVPRAVINATLDRYLVQPHGSPTKSHGSSGSNNPLGALAAQHGGQHAQGKKKKKARHGKGKERATGAPAESDGDDLREQYGRSAADPDHHHGNVATDSDFTSGGNADSEGDYSDGYEVNPLESAAHSLAGGDMVRDLYKMREKEIVERRVLRSHKRSKSETSLADLANASPRLPLLTDDEESHFAPGQQQYGSMDQSGASVSALATQLAASQKTRSASPNRPAGAVVHEFASKPGESATAGDPPSPTLNVERLRAPNGFRRFFVINKFIQKHQNDPVPPQQTVINTAAGVGLAQAAAAQDQLGGGTSRPMYVRAVPRLPADSFLDFLLGVSVYGRFAGGWLWDEDEKRLEDHLEVVYEEDDGSETDDEEGDEEIDLTTALEAGPSTAGVSTSSAEAAGGTPASTLSRNKRRPSNLRLRQSSSASLPEDEEKMPLLTSPRSSRSLRDLRSPTAPRLRSLPSRGSLRSSGLHGPEPGQGTASPRKVFLLLIKSFIGTGVLFLPAAFKDGGFTFSIVFLAVIAYLSMYGMLLLVKTNAVIPGSFGDIAEHTYGPRMRHLVHTSIALSQIGFCMAYIVFVAQNARALIATFTNCKYIPTQMVAVAAQLALYIPLALVRKIRTFAITALVANVFTFIGLFVVVAFDIKTIVDRGHVADVQQFNPDSFALYIGTAVYTFEGVGLVIPIAQSMREPSKFPTVLSLTMILTTALYILVASMSYLAFGDDIKTIVLLNLPEGNPVATTVHILYIAAIMFTWPLVLFPAVRIVESGMLPDYDGKRNPSHKWAKNAFRTALVILIGVGAYFGSSSLDKLVAIIGSFACIPLSFIYPTLFHLKIFGHQSLRVRIIDLSLLAFGVVAMVYVTGVTMHSWITGSGAGNGEGDGSLVCVPHSFRP